MLNILNIRNSFPSFVRQTPLEINEKLSQKYGCTIYLKREDLQTVRSYKIRGAYCKISQLSMEEKSRGVVCASAGNHAQGVALCCKELQIKGVIYMPETTPKQKINMVKGFGEDWIEVVLKGDTFDEANKEGKEFALRNERVFIPPFDDEFVIAGQGTVAHEIWKQSDTEMDVIVTPVGGGGLAAGIISYLREVGSKTKVLGIEPHGAASMTEALKQGTPVALNHIDKFVDGASVKRVGDLNFDICKQGLEEMVLVEEGKICSTILEVYNSFGIVLEPAGALTIASLDQLAEKGLIQGKKVVLIVSGGNNDITRTEEIRERSMFYEGLKHYFLIRFPQRPGALREFVTEVVGPEDDIVYFQFSNKTNRENGPAVVGVELKKREDVESIKKNLHQKSFQFEYLVPNSLLFQQLIG